MKTFEVVRIEKRQLVVTGKGKHPLWDKANTLSDFCSPWNRDIEKIKTLEFKALWDECQLFFCFRVEDSEVHIDTTDNSNKSINNSDRVELFFRTNKSLDPYYCLEMDPTPRVMDFKARPNKIFDFDWNWSIDDIEVKSSINLMDFTVEEAISIALLTELGLLKEGKIEIGIYRAKYNKQSNGNFDPTWITWVNPNTETPNFHTPTSFGVLNLKGY